MAKNNKELFIFYEWSTGGTALVLIVIYTTILVLIKRESNEPSFVIYIILLLIVSNIGAIIEVGCNYVFTILEPKSVPLLQSFNALQFVGGSIREGCFNIAHWSFAHEYYCSAAAMPYIFARQEMPESHQKNLALFNKIILAINIFFVLSYDILQFTINFMLTEHTDLDMTTKSALFYAWLSTHYGVGLMQLVSGIYLLVAVNKIRTFLVNQGMSKQVNYKAMTVHAVSFSLYNISIIVFYIFYYQYLTESNENKKSRRREVLIAWIVSSYMTFAAQICLNWIFLQFRSKEEKEIIEVIPIETVEEINDSILRLTSDEMERYMHDPPKSPMEVRCETFIDENFGTEEETTEDPEDSDVRKSETS